MKAEKNGPEQNPYRFSNAGMESPPHLENPPHNWIPLRDMLVGLVCLVTITALVVLGSKKPNAENEKDAISIQAEPVSYRATTPLTCSFIELSSLGPMCSTTRDAR